MQFYKFVPMTFIINFEVLVVFYVPMWFYYFYYAFAC